MRGLCSACRSPQDRPGQRYCRACHARYMRGWRPAYSELTPIERLKSRARSYANVYQRRGRLKPRPCTDCGGKAEKHHDDYAKPLSVAWLCRKCHLALHRRLKTAPRHVKHRSCTNDGAI